jgi:hypothetical protein
MLASTFDALTHWVDMAAPLKFTIAEELKFRPSTSRLNDELPAAVLAGLSWEIFGTVPGAGGIFAGFE